MRSSLNQTQPQLSKFSVPEPHLSAARSERGCWLTQQCPPCVLNVFSWCGDVAWTRAPECVWGFVCYPLIHFGLSPAHLPSWMPRNYMCLYSFSHSVTKLCAVIFSRYCWSNMSHFSEFIWKLFVGFWPQLEPRLFRIISGSSKQPGGPWYVIRDVE